LFARPDAPIELLELTKEFAKQTLKDSEEMQLKEVASGLYYVTYAASIVFHRKIIGSMKEDELRAGFNWGLKQTWLDKESKKLIEQAVRQLAEGITT